MTAIGEYRYRIKSTEASSAKFGLCEVCGKHASEVFLQVEEQFYKFDNEEGWTRHRCSDWFGHRECLIDQRKGSTDEPMGNQA